MPRLGKSKGEGARRILTGRFDARLEDSNEVGESFRPVFPRLVVPSYVLAFGYVFADVEYQRRKQTTSAKMVAAAVDTLVWQTLASVLIPGFVINRVVWASQSILKRSPLRSNTAKQWAPVFIGLSAVPFIVEPIDTAVHWGMDTSIRKLYDLGVDT